MEATQLDDTIVAISTPQGEGGIGIVRLSGPRAIALVRGAFESSSGRNLDTDSRPVFHGIFRANGTPLDEVLVHVMRAPHSYTREDVVEINGHGGQIPLNAMLDHMVCEGARLAEPGEFTKRAFLNGRLDLVQAEAVIDRIRAHTLAGLRAAAAAASGALSTEIHEIHDALVEAKAFIEAAVDFPDDDLPELLNPELQASIVSTVERMRALLATADAGKLYREGTSIAIVGRPNVGKSSLFNAMLRDSRAIVTPDAGTTRDRIEEVISLEGIPLRLSDTAGLHEAGDQVEAIGMERTREALRSSGVVLFVVDASEKLTAEDRAIAREVEALDVPVLLVHNKTDIATDGHAAPDGEFAATVRVSAKTGDGITELETRLAEVLKRGAQTAPDQALITRSHQKDSLRRALEAAERLSSNFDASPEFLSIDLNDAIQALGEITGETTPDDVLERIFSSFCIGK